MSSSSRRPIAVAAATLTAAALGATALMLPATAAERPTGPVKITGGTLDWGVRESYRKYVTGMAHGRMTVADGARRNADGTFRFGAATGQYDPAAGHVVKAAFKGSVTFFSPAPPTGHGFEVKLSDFRFDTGTKKLTADVTKSGKTDQDVPLAGVAFAGQAMTNLATTLTEQAATALGSASYAGTPGDPLTAALEFEKPRPSPSPSSTSAKPTPPTGGPTVKPSSTATTPPATGGPQKVLAGRATWGMKESFRRYVQGAGGTVTPAGGAVKNGELFDFSFGRGELDTGGRRLTASFDGSLRFLYAAHGIDMTFGNLRVEGAGRTGTLVLDVKTASGQKTGVRFATLDLSGTDYKPNKGVLALGAVPAALTADGAAVFANGTTGSPYKAGDPVDPLTLSVSVAGNAPLPNGGTAGSGTGTGTAGTTTGTGTGTAGTITGGGGTVGGNLAATGAELPAGALLAASGTAVALGAGAVYAARTRRTARD
ncbi:HtaA domain-containing protein [Streptomyces sp. NPDC012888]|uniref:HtaA domain-containing protein n=1 Tax=Streptomyces sp. NPDC012888 TaxID=3364855 RepID=UPI0036B8A881